MPNRDGTGPQRKGAKTGMQRGDCDGAEFQGGQGRGQNTGGRFGFPAGGQLNQMSLDEREKFLKSQLEVVYKEKEKIS